MHDICNYYSEGIRELLEHRSLLREPVWTEALAIGDRPFVENIATSFVQRRRFLYDDIPDADPGTCYVREDEMSYS